VNQTFIDIFLILCLSMLIIYSFLGTNRISFSVNNSADIMKENNSPIFNITKAYEYLVNRYDAHYGLVKESENIDKYWLWSDNILGAQALKDYSYVLYINITNTIRNYIHNHHISLNSAWIALVNPTSTIQSPSFKAPINKNLLNNIWYSDYVGPTELGCTDYADIAFLKSIYFFEVNNPDKSKECYNAGLNMFDGIGFKDKAFISDGYEYATYKVALWKIVTNVTGLINTKEAPEVISKIQNVIIGKMQNRVTGGEYTHYSANLIPNNQTNVETTSLAIIASKRILLPGISRP